MSITGIETNPVGEDIAHIADPGHDAKAEPSEPSENILDSITHLTKHGRSRDVRNHPAYEHQPATRDPDAVLTGTRDYPERYTHDEALQVRQLLPSRWDVTPFPVSTVVPVSILPARAERMGMQVFNNGPAVAYIGPMSQKATPATGFPLAVGASQSLDSLDQVWACSDGSGVADLRILETFRTDNRGS